MVKNITSGFFKKNLKESAFFFYAFRVFMKSMAGSRGFYAKACKDYALSTSVTMGNVTIKRLEIMRIPKV